MKPNAENKSEMKLKKFFCIFILLLVLCIGLFFFYNIWMPAEGSHTGMVTATEKNWFVWWTNAVYFKTDPQSTQEDIYCAVDQAVFDKLKQYESQRIWVTIYFENDILVPRWECGTGVSIITRVEPAG